MIYHSPYTILHYSILGPRRAAGPPAPRRGGGAWHRRPPAGLGRGRRRGGRQRHRGPHRGRHARHVRLPGHRLRGALRARGRRPRLHAEGQGRRHLPLRQRPLALLGHELAVGEPPAPGPYMLCLLYCTSILYHIILLYNIMSYYYITLYYKHLKYRIIELHKAGAGRHRRGAGVAELQAVEDVPAGRPSEKGQTGSQ